MDSFNGKRAIITGGSSGIGLAIARLLVREGVSVHLVARRMDQLRLAKQELAQIGSLSEDDIRIYSVDVSDNIQVSNVLSPIAKEGNIDILINSAGITYPGTFVDQDLEIFKNLMNVNYFGTIYVIRAILPAMLRCGSGHIVNLSSVAGYLGTYGYSAYGATKFAIRGLSDVLRAELKPEGIHVSIVFPPDTQTPQLEWEQAYKPAITKALSSNAKVISAEKVAEEILRGIRKRKYLILPGFDNKLFYFLDHLPGNLAYPIMDYLIRDAMKKNNHDG